MDWIIVIGLGLGAFAFLFAFGSFVGKCMAVGSYDPLETPRGHERIGNDGE